MGEEFSYGYGVVDGEGKFGCMDGEGGAGMRYREGGMSKIRLEVLGDMNKERIDFIEKYDGNEREG